MSLLRHSLQLQTSNHHYLEFSNKTVKKSGNMVCISALSVFIIKDVFLTDQQLTIEDNQMPKKKSYKIPLIIAAILLVIIAAALYLLIAPIANIPSWFIPRLSMLRRSIRTSRTTSSQMPATCISSKVLASLLKLHSSRCFWVSY